MKYRRLDIPDFCRWVFRSGWAKDMACARTAWYALNGEPRCTQHRQTGAPR